MTNEEHDFKITGKRRKWTQDLLTVCVRPFFPELQIRVEKLGVETFPYFLEILGGKFESFPSHYARTIGVICHQLSQLSDEFLLMLIPRSSYVLVEYG